MLPAKGRRLPTSADIPLQPATRRKMRGRYTGSHSTAYSAAYLNSTLLMLARSGCALSSRWRSYHACQFFDIEVAQKFASHLSSAIESVDGTGNNLANTLWGSAGVDLMRLAKAAYGDGISTPALASDLSARTISNTLNNWWPDPADTSADIATIDQNSLSGFRLCLRAVHGS